MKFLILGKNDDYKMILRLQIVGFSVSIRDRSTTNSVVVLSYLTLLIDVKKGIFRICRNLKNMSTHILASTMMMSDRA